jgi:hypothetical protein
VKKYVELMQGKLWCESEKALRSWCSCRSKALATIIPASDFGHQRRRRAALVLGQQKGQWPSSAALFLPVCVFFLSAAFSGRRCFPTNPHYFHHIADAYQKGRGNPAFLLLGIVTGHWSIVIGRV